MWRDGDLEQLRAEGRDPEVVAAQLARLTGPRPWTRVQRAATVGDGIRRLDALPGVTTDDLDATWRRSALSGRLGTFVPASGAATRMCKAMLSAWKGGDGGPVAERVLAHPEQLAMWPALIAAGAHRDDPRSVLSALFDGLALHELPKGLVTFHEGRTAYDEQLEEARALCEDGQGRVRAHFTVGAEHRESFEARPSRGVSVSFSVQEPVTNTPAVWLDGEPCRVGGRLLFRPAGHGALLGNLEAVGGDVLLVKNIDNVVPEADRLHVVHWRRRLAGLLVWIQEHAGAAMDAGPHAARAFAETWLGEVQGDPIAALDRPWRVVGMVRNEGQPGGGPFWVDGPEGARLQIVEGVQINGLDDEQVEIVASATHFNPVDMALGMRGPGGAYQLADFVDEGAWIVTEKSHQGVPLRALEFPGLWNGGMGGWNTVFVEVPASTFRPVKTLADLLGRG